MNKAIDSIGGKLKIFMNTYDKRGMNKYCETKPITTATGILIIFIKAVVSSKIPIKIDITHEKKMT